MSFKLKEIYPRIYLATFDGLYEMGMTMVRIQEFYESPEFKGKNFDLEEYMDWWAKTEGKDCFDYPAVWGGYNVPGSILQDWYNKVFELRDKEWVLFDALEKHMPLHKGLVESYLIAACSKEKNIKDNIRHETAHAFYCLYPAYKNGCKKLIREISPNVYDKMKKFLIKGGYDKSVIDDEIQAYCSSLNGGGSRVPIKSRKKFVKHFDEFSSTVK